MSAGITVNLGAKLFQFGSFTDWVDHASWSWKRIGVKSADTICLDTKGRPCLIGRDFMKARDEEAFPVSVYLLRGDLKEYEHLNPAPAAATPSFCYSHDEERFHGDFNTEAEALTEVFSSAGNDRVYIGEVCHPSEYFTPQGVGADIFERISEQLGEEVGEVAECFTMTGLERESLGAMVLQFISDGPGFSCFGVKNVRAVTREEFESGGKDIKTVDMFAGQEGRAGA